MNEFVFLESYRHASFGKGWTKLQVFDRQRHFYWFQDTIKDILGWVSKTLMPDIYITSARVIISRVTCKDLYLYEFKRGLDKDSEVLQTNYVVGFWLATLLENLSAKNKFPFRDATKALNFDLKWVANLEKSSWYNPSLKSCHQQHLPSSYVLY